MLAAQVRPGKAQFLAQEIGQRDARLNLPGSRFAVDGKRNLNLSHQFRKLIAWSMARPVSTSTSSVRYSAEAWWSERGVMRAAAMRAASTIRLGSGTWPRSACALSVIS